LFILSRRTTEVLVVDEAGMPLAGAEIALQSLSINYAGKTTDGDGAVRLPLVPQPIHWISVRKKGYQDYRSGDIEHMKRVVVILRKVPNNRAGVDTGLAGLFAFRRPLPGTTQHGR
jgi:hypothetical protein